MVNIVDYSKCLDVLINYGYSEESIIEVLNKLFEINGISELTNYRLDNKLISTAQFVPRYNKIFINPSRIPIWLKNNIDDDNILPNIEDRNKLKDYYVLNILVHEVEHAKQYLVGKELLNTNSKIVTYAYRSLMDLLIKPNDILPRPIKEIRRYIRLSNYLKNKESYLLERNANLEAYNITGVIANSNGDIDISQEFISIAFVYMKIGYRENNEGCLIKTLTDLNFDVPEYIDSSKLEYIKRIHLGLPLNNDERIRLLNMK